MKNNFKNENDLDEEEWHPWEHHFPHHGPPHPPPKMLNPTNMRHRPHVPFDPLIPPPRFRRHFRTPRIPFTNEDFQNIKHFLILSIINESEAGITGYQLQKHHELPRGTLIHVLDKLEELGYLSIHEDTKEGRAHKYYQITDLGKKHLEDLKENWASRFLVLSEMAPPDKYGHPFHRKNLRSKMMMDIEEITEKEEAIDYFRGMRSRLRSYIKRVRKKEQRLDEIKEIFDELISKIEDMPSLDQERIKVLIKKF